MATKEPKAKDMEKESKERGMEARDMENQRSVSTRDNGSNSPTSYRRGMANPIDRLFENFLREWPVARMGSERQWRWGMDIEDRDNEVVIRAEAPGFEAEDFDIQMRGDQLTVCACHKGGSEDKENGFSEWNQQEYYRSLTLPVRVDAGKIEARYRNGVLDLKLPKTEESKAQRIAVKG